jgi:hypothetical protein
MVLLLSTFSPDSNRYYSGFPNSGVQLCPWDACPPELLYWLVGFCSSNNNQNCWRRFTFMVLLLSTFAPDSDLILRPEGGLCLRGPLSRVLK